MTRPAEIRRRILKQRGVEFKYLTRKAVPIEETPATYPKSNLMRLTELRFKEPLEKLIATGTIYELEKKLGVDASTVSKWRKLIQQAKDKEFFDQFN